MYWTKEWESFQLGLQLSFRIIINGKQENLGIWYLSFLKLTWDYDPDHLHLQAEKVCAVSYTLPA